MRGGLPRKIGAGAVKRPAVALIDEPRCIGCARCIEACPVDAIAGAPGFLHTVIADYCTGCELCLPPCPVDCIEMAPPPGPWTARDAAAARRRAAALKQRSATAVRKTTSARRRAVIAAILKAKPQ